ncbi:hypothetical protein FRC00_002258 [Tulasnella sp. 408]|nr:hypothetical protein FRC00_002258 [Tulasnella sp. 408]
MVTTRRGASNAKSNENLNAPEDIDNEGLPSEKPERKRRKPQKFQNDNEDSDGLAPGPSRNPDSAKTEQIVRRTGNRGKLRDMMDMPIDIFTERIRDILMTKGAKRIWMAALASVPGLPECPTDLSEPQYVRLMFTHDCDVLV